MDIKRICAAILTLLAIWPLQATAQNKGPGRQVLVMAFTSASCGPCAIAAGAIERLKAEAGDSLSLMAVHYYDFYKIPEAESLAAYYQVVGTPTYWFDGSDEVLYGDTMTYHNYRMAFDKWKEMPAVLSIGLSGTYDQQERAGTAACQVINTGADTIDGILRVALVERAVFHPWGGGDSLFDLLRDMAPNFQGVRCHLGGGQAASWQFPFNIDPGWFEDRMELVAWIQAAKGKASASKAVLNSGRIGLELLTGAAGQSSRPLKPHSQLAVRAWPNPARGSTVVSAWLPHPGNITISLYNLAGQRLSISDLGWQQSGNHQVRLALTRIDGRPLATGIYYLAVEGNNERDIKQFIIIK